MNKSKKEYIVYDKQENVVMLGTSNEITKKLGITKGTFYSYVSRGDLSKSNYKIFAVKLNMRKKQLRNVKKEDNR